MLLDIVLLFSLSSLIFFMSTSLKPKTINTFVPTMNGKAPLKSTPKIDNSEKAMKPEYGKNILMNSIKSSMQPVYTQSGMDRVCFLGRNSTKNPSGLTRSVIKNLGSHNPNRSYRALTPSRCGIQNQDSGDLSELQADL